MRNQRKDTIYAGNYYKKEKFKSKGISVRIDNGKSNDPNRPLELKRYQKNILRFTVDRFEKYPLSIIKVKGGQIHHLDTSIHTFEVYPTDSLLSFELHQDYGKENVVILHRVWTDSISNRFEERIVAQNGVYRISEIILSCD